MTVVPPKPIWIELCVSLVTGIILHVGYTWNAKQFPPIIDCWQRSCEFCSRDQVLRQNIYQFYAKLLKLLGTTFKKILDSRLSRQWRFIVCGIWIMTPCSLARSSYVECHLTEIRGVAVGTCEKARQQKTKQITTCRPREREVYEDRWWEWCLIFIHELF
jgi:hypothetical protein